MYVLRQLKIMTTSKHQEFTQMLLFSEPEVDTGKLMSAPEKVEPLIRPSLYLVASALVSKNIHCGDAAIKSVDLSRITDRLVSRTKYF